MTLSAATRSRLATRAWRLPAPSADWPVVGVSGLVAAAIGLTAGTSHMVAVLPVAALGGVLLLVDARARILFLVFGGLLTLQSSDSVGSLKLVYLAGILVSFAGALFEVGRSRNAVERARARPLMRGSLVLASLLAVSLFVSRYHGVPRTDWLRDIAPYMLFALAPVFALDAGSALSRRALVRILVIAGFVATVSFATHWISQRHITRVPLSRFALSSFYFPAALFAYAVARALQDRQHRGRWMLFAILVFGLLRITSTRTTLLLALAPIVAVASARRQFGARFVRLAVVGPIALVLMLGGTYAAVKASHLSTTVISDRISILKKSGTASDASYLDRQAQTHAAAKVFRANPVFGAGPGTFFNWRTTDGFAQTSFILDSSVDFPAKFGILGLAVVGFLLASYWSFIRRACLRAHPRPETLALIAYAVLVVAGTALATPLEDKGSTLGFVLLLALVFRTWPQIATDRAVEKPFDSERR